MQRKEGEHTMLSKHEIRNYIRFIDHALSIAKAFTNMKKKRKEHILCMDTWKKWHIFGYIGEINSYV